jgi:hypothetical protein
VDDGDAPRLLAQRSEHGYTDRLDLALHDEPEAIRADEQEQQTQAAHRRDRQRRLEAFVALRDVVFVATDDFLDVVGPAGGIGSNVRAIRRSVALLEQRVAR